MTSRDFCFWAQGFFEIQKPETLNKEQVEMIKRHLNLVFVHDIDPSMGDEKVQDTLNAIHNTPITTAWKPGKQPDGIIARC